MPSGEMTNTKFIIFGLTRLRIETTIYSPFDFYKYPEINLEKNIFQINMLFPWIYVNI